MSAKTKVIQKNIDTQELNIMMEQILNDKGDPDIVAEKKTEMEKCVKACSQYLHHLVCDNGLFHKRYGDIYDEWREQLIAFKDSCIKLIDEEKLEYSELKEHRLIKRLIFICRDLQPFQFHLENQGKEDINYKGSWILNHPGPSLQPFSFSDFNLKAIWQNDDTNENMRKYLFIIILKLFNKCKQIFNLISTPDIDISEFSKAIVGAISKIKKVPELNRCHDAFKKLEQSVNMLEGNFGNYYKDMLQSQDPTLLIVNFIQDVSNSDGMDIKLVYQFRKIVNYYRKQTQGKIKDPELKKKFDMLSSRFSMLDEQVSKMHEQETGCSKDPEDSSDTDAEPAEPSTEATSIVDALNSQ